jgi:ribosomal protein S18 acetylase RimI-like enzyme
MRRNLGTPIMGAVLPDGAHLVPFSADQAGDVHALLLRGYSDCGGAVGPFAQWWQLVSSDSEYDADLCFTVRSSKGYLIAAAQCWTSAFVKDIAVHPEWQRRGIGAALLSEIFRAFRTRGANAVDLKVQTDNPSAMRFYEKLGMMPVRDPG